MRLIAILLAMIVATFVRQAVAHPHVFIAWHIEPQIEKGAIAAVKLHWRFDDLYSDLVINTIDRDGDRKLSPAEIDALAKRTLANLEKVKFYAHFTPDGVAWQAEKAEHFTATVDGDHVIYVFTLKLPTPAKSLTVWSFDPEYYIEMRIDKGQQTTGAGFACTVGRGEPVKTETWGSITPDTVSCSVQ